MRSLGDNGSARWEFSVEELLTKLRENRTAHVEEYEEAHKGYMDKLKDKLRQMLESVEANKVIDTHINFERPRSHEKDYDRIIEILEMTTADTVYLTLDEFDRYVRDEWDWTERFKSLSNAYNNG